MSEMIMVKASANFKEAAATYAATHNKTLSELMRECVAEVIGYDLGSASEMDVRGRPRKYESDNERKIAANKRAQDRAARQRAVLAAIQKQAEQEASDRAERLEGVEALEQYLRLRGVSLDDTDADTDTTAA